MLFETFLNKSLEKQQTRFLDHISSVKGVDILQDVFQGILQAHHPNSVDNVVHTAAKGQLNIRKTPRCLGGRTCWRTIESFEEYVDPVQQANNRVIRKICRPCTAGN